MHSLFGSKFPLLLFLVWVMQSLLKRPGIKPFRNSVAKWGVLYCVVFSDTETMQLVTDSIKFNSKGGRANGLMWRFKKLGMKFLHRDKNSKSSLALSGR